MTYYKTNIKYEDDYVYCLEEDDYLCSQNCMFCPNKMHLSEVYKKWQEIIKESKNSFSRRLMDCVSYDEFYTFVNLHGFEPGDPHSVFIGHDETYEEIAASLPSYIDTVIDFGGSNGLQYHIFENVRYIDVDDFGWGCSPEFYLAKAQDFIREHLEEFNQDTTLAICLNVPDEEARQAVIDNFKHKWVMWKQCRIA